MDTNTDNNSTEQMLIKISSKNQGNITDFSQIFLYDQNSDSYKFKDVEFICKDGILYGHRSILMSMCGFFQKIFYEEQKESMTTIYLPEFEVRFFSLVLVSLYTGGAILKSSDIPEIFIILEQLGINLRDTCTIKCAKTEDLDSYYHHNLKINDLKGEVDEFNYISEFNAFLSSLKPQSQQQNTSQKIDKSSSTRSQSKSSQRTENSPISNNNTNKTSSTSQPICPNIFSSSAATAIAPINDHDNYKMPTLTPQVPVVPKNSPIEFKCFICQKIENSYEEFNEHLKKEECGKSLVGKFTFNESLKQCRICSTVFEKISSDIFMKHVKLCDDRIIIKKEKIEEREKLVVSSSESESSSSSSSESDDEDAIIPVLVPVNTKKPVSIPIINTERECRIILEKLPRAITEKYNESLLKFIKTRENPPLDSDSDDDIMHKRQTRSSNNVKSNSSPEIISLVYDSDSENEKQEDSIQKVKRNKGPLSYKLFNCHVCSANHQNFKALSDCLTSHNKIKCYICLEIFRLDILERHMKKKHKSPGSSELIDCSHCHYSLQWDIMNAHIIEVHYKGRTENKNYKPTTNRKKKNTNDAKAKTKDQDVSLIKPYKKIPGNRNKRSRVSQLSKSSPGISESISNQASKIHKTRLNILASPNNSNSSTSLKTSTVSARDGDKTHRNQIAENSKSNNVANSNQHSPNILSSPNNSISNANDASKKSSKKTTSAFLLANKSNTSIGNKKRKNSSSSNVLLDYKAKFHKSNSSISSNKSLSHSLISSPLPSLEDDDVVIVPTRSIHSSAGSETSFEEGETSVGAKFHHSIKVNKSLYNITTLSKKGENEKESLGLLSVPNTSNSQDQSSTGLQVVNRIGSSSYNSSCNTNNDSSTLQAEVGNIDNDNTDSTDNNNSEEIQVNPSVPSDRSLEMIESLLASTNDDISYRSRNYACNKCKETFINKCNFDGHVCI